MIPFPTPFLSRSAIYRGPARHLVIGRASQGGGVRLVGFISGDASMYHRRPFEGDIVNFLGPSPYFFPRASLVAGGKFYLGGSISSAGAFRPALFVSDVDDPFHLNELTTGFAAVSGNSEIVGLAANGSYIVALEQKGSVSVTTDGGDAWARYDTLTPGGLTALSIAASSTAFVVGFQNNGLRTAADPRGAWLSQASGFDLAPATANSIRLAMAGSSLFVLSAQAQVSTSPVASGVLWSRRTTPIDPATAFANGIVGTTDGGDAFLIFGSAMVGGEGQATLVRSLNGIDWASTLSLPWVPSLIGQSGFLGGRFYGYSGSRIFVSDDVGESWSERVTNLGTFGAVTGSFHVPLIAA